MESDVGSLAIQQVVIVCALLLAKCLGLWRVRNKCSLALIGGIEMIELLVFESRGSSA